MKQSLFCASGTGDRPCLIGRNLALGEGRRRARTTKLTRSSSTLSRSLLFISAFAEVAVVILILSVDRVTSHIPSLRCEPRGGPSSKII